MLRRRRVGKARAACRMLGKSRLKYSETTLQWREGGDKKFRIGEFSKLTQVSIRRLRYYDPVGLLTPAVVDRWTGHRFYSVEQISQLQKILRLRA